MTFSRLALTLAVLGSTLAVVASACGGGGDVPASAVAVVDGTEIPRAKLDQLVEQAKKSFAAQDQEFPKVGTPEYQNVQTQYVAHLVQVEQYEQAAEELGIEVTEKDVDKELADFVKSRFNGDRKQFARELEKQGFTEESFRDTLRTSVLSKKLYDAVTKDVEVAEADTVAYYSENLANYRTPESRDVRHILISEKGKNGQVDFAKSKAEADRIYAELRGGADFAALAKESSDDPGSKTTGGKLTISRGQTVPEFDKTAFELKQGVVSRPVKTQFGYHVIEALSPVREAKTTPIDEVRASIKATLLQEKRTTAVTEWVKDLQEDYEDKVSYAAGFEPPELPEETETETETSTE